MSPSTSRSLLAERGAILERCFAPIHTGKVSWEQTFEAIRATGAERNVLSTDLGQVANPPVEDGLALMADALLEAGFAEDEIRTMAVVNTRRLAGVSSRLLVVSAHSADFVWRAAGAIATVVEAGGTARVVALSYGERGESGELWKEPGQTEERVKEIRHGEARDRGRRARRRVSHLRPRRLPARDRRRPPSTG